MNEFHHEFGRLRPGLVVRDINGSVLGSVSRLYPDKFELFTSVPPPLVLRPDCLFSVSDHTVTLLCDGANLTSYVVPLEGDGHAGG